MPQWVPPSERRQAGGRAVGRPVFGKSSLIRLVGDMTDGSIHSRYLAASKCAKGRPFSIPKATLTPFILDVLKNIIVFFLDHPSPGGSRGRVRHATVLRQS